MATSNKYDWWKISSFLFLGKATFLIVLGFLTGQPAYILTFLIMGLPDLLLGLGLFKKLKFTFWLAVIYVAINIFYNLLRWLTYFGYPATSVSFGDAMGIFFFVTQTVSVFMLWKQIRQQKGK